eukprot:881289_1
MWSLEKVIQLQALLETLNQNEFELFFSAFTTMCGRRELITKSSLHLLVYEKKHNPINSYENNAYALVTAIISLRKSDDDPIVSSATPYPASFDNLPSVVISKCASYLQSKELNNFFLCNRHSYISCKSIPTTITALLNPSWFSRYCCNYGIWGYAFAFYQNQKKKLDQFRKIKHVAVLEKDILEITLVDRWLWPWNYLDTLAISEINYFNDGSTCWHSCIHDFLADADTNVKHLQLQVNKIRLDRYFECICWNKNIEYLTLMEVELETEPMSIIPTMEELSDGGILAPFSNLSKLRGIAFVETDTYEDHELRYIVANRLSPQLQSLHVHTGNVAFHDERVPVHSWGNSDYSQLQELCTSGINMDQVKDILQSANQLKRLHLSVDPAAVMDRESFDEILDGVLNGPAFETLEMALSQPSLQYLSITTSSIVEYIFLIISILSDEETTGETAKPKRKNFKLRLNTKEFFGNPLDDTLGNLLYSAIPGFQYNKLLESLVKILERFVTNDFMLSIQCRSDSEFGGRLRNELKDEVKPIGENYQTYLSLHMQNYDEPEQEDVFEQMTLVICNRNNTMGGIKFTESWDMSCAHLEDIA